MYSPTRYLAWARRFYGRVPFDLATSGIPRISSEELGAPAAPADDASGWASLRGAIARYNDVPEDEAISALGASGAIWLAYATLLSPGDEVLVEDPGYEPLWRAAEGVGAKIVRFPRAEKDHWRIDLDAVARCLGPKTRIISVSNLHNPSGVRTSEATLRELARLAKSRGAHLLVDEVYAPFDTLTDDDGVFRGSARRLGENVVVASSLTKCYGLGDERIGWLLAAPDVIERAGHTVTAMCGMPPLSHAHLGAHAFSRARDLSARARRLVGRKRERVAAWMATRPDLSWSDPMDGLFGFAVSSRAGDLTPLIEIAAEERGVLVAAGSFFGVPNGFRLAWALPEDKLDAALDHLGSALPKP